MNRDDSVAHESLNATRLRLVEEGATIAAELPNALIPISYAVLLTSRPCIKLLLPCRQEAIEPFAFDGSGIHPYGPAWLLQFLGFMPIGRLVLWLPGRAAQKDAPTGI